CAGRSLSDGVTPTRRRPESCKVGMNICHMRCWPFPCGVDRLPGRFSPWKPGSVRVCTSKRLILVKAISDRYFLSLGGSGRSLSRTKCRNQTGDSQGKPCNSGVAHESDIHFPLLRPFQVSQPSSHNPPGKPSFAGLVFVFALGTFAKNNRAPVREVHCLDEPKVPGTILRHGGVDGNLVAHVEHSPDHSSPSQVAWRASLKRIIGYRSILVLH